VDQQSFAGGDVALDDFAGQIQKDRAETAHPLQDEALAPEKPRADPLVPGNLPVTDFSAHGKVSLRQISDWLAANCTGMIVPGKRGANATCPLPRAVKSVTNRLPPLSVRMKPAKMPPPVVVFISTASFIQHIVLVWL